MILKIKKKRKSAASHKPTLQNTQKHYLFVNKILAVDYDSSDFIEAKTDIFNFQAPTRNKLKKAL